MKRIVINGCGGMGRFWRNLVLERGGVQIVGAVDPDETALRQFVDEASLDDFTCGSDLADVLEQTKPDFLIDASIPSAHIRSALTSMELGVPVLCEKPMAVSIDEAIQIIDTARKTRVPFSVVQNRRFDENLDRLCSFLRSGEIGSIMEVHSDFFTALSGGGFRGEMSHVLLEDMAVHTFDTARVICESDAEEVHCQDWNPENSWFKGGASAFAHFRMGNGIVYTYRGNWTTIGCSTSWQANWRILCTEGSVLWDGDSNLKAEKLDRVEEGWRHSVEVEIPQNREQYPNGHAGCLEDFISSLENGKNSRSWSEDNFHTLSMSLAAIRSSKFGNTMKVPQISTYLETS